MHISTIEWGCLILGRWMDGWEMMGVSLCLWQIIMSVMYIEMIGDNPAMYCIDHTQS